MKGRYPDRFVVFANLSYDDLNTPGYGKRAAARLEQDVKSGGAQGLKIFKNFGMDVKYAGGQRVHVDDPEFDPVWDKCAELGIPVLIHIAEPAAFFDPWDYHNERWLELKQFPGRARPPDKYPPFETLIVERNRLFAKHPKTNFIAAHLAFHGNDLERLGETLDALPNMYVHIAAVLAELGRQPYSAHDFLVKYQDRVLMGKDIYEVSEYKWYFRALETRDEYFEYYRPRHAFWHIEKQARDSSRASALAAASRDFDADFTAWRTRQALSAGGPLLPSCYSAQVRCAARRPLIRPPGVRKDSWRKNCRPR